MNKWSPISRFLESKAKLGNEPKLDTPFSPAVPEEEAEYLDEICNAGEDLHAEDQFFAICYVNAKGEESLRRIVVWGLKVSSSGYLILRSKCVEKKQNRDFRADRIKYCIDLDGVIYEPPSDFLAETFGLTPERIKTIGSFKAPARRSTSDRESDYSDIRNKLKNELIVMSAIAESDGNICFPEAVEIISYVRARARGLRLKFPTELEGKLEGHIRRLRPTSENVISALDEIAGLPIPKQIAFLEACHRVMMADGIVHEAELKLLEEVRQELLGC